jgi:hypothetical protein
MKARLWFMRLWFMRLTGVDLLKDSVINRN